MWLHKKNQILSHYSFIWLIKICSSYRDKRCSGSKLKVAHSPRSPVFDHVLLMQSSFLLEGFLICISFIFKLDAISASVNMWFAEKKIKSLPHIHNFLNIMTRERFPNHFFLSFLGYIQFTYI